MRRSLLCLAMMLLAAMTAFRIVTDGAQVEIAVAQESPRSANATSSVAAPTAAKAAPREASAHVFSIPADAEVTVLVDFVKQLRRARPEAGPDQDEFDEKASAAIRTACQRIVELERNDASEAHRFASRELLLFRIEELSEQETVEPDECRRIANQALKLLRVSERQAVDVEQATMIATAFEEFAPLEDARKLYEGLSELFVRSTNAEIARRGAYLAGAAHRLGIIGKPFELTGQTMRQTRCDIASLKGQVVLVDFWATWCGHCLDEIPNLKRNYRAYHDQGFEIIGVSVDDDRDALETFLKKHQISWTTLHDEEAGSEHPATIQYGITAYPTTFLIDRSGRVIATDLRGRKLSRKLAELFAGNTDKASPYPVFNVNEVVDTLTTEGSRLYKQGKTRTDAELRRQMHRQSVEVDLQEPSDEPISDRNLYRRASESVFIVCSLYKSAGVDEWQTSLATAFAVTSDGVLSTSCHVFDNEDTADAVVVMDVHRKVYPVRELLAVNKLADTCLFRIPAGNLQPLPLADDALPGTQVRIMGHPGDSFYFLSSGLLANYERDHEGTTWLNTTADFGQGSSGGPVLDECGNVVGQVSRTFTLYAGGPARGRPRRVAGEPAAEKATKTPATKGDAEEDVADPQMVFKSCVPVKTLRSLVKPATH